MKINKGQVRWLYNILFVPILIVFLVVTEWEPFVGIGALPYTLLLEDGWKQADKRHSQARSAFLKAAREDWISENRAVLERKVSEKVEPLFSDLEDSAAAYREFRDGFDQSIAELVAALEKELEELPSAEEIEKIPFLDRRIREKSRVISANQCFQWFEKSFSIVTERTL